MTGAGFAHDALLYEGDDDLVARAVPFVRAGLDAEEPVMVALTGGKLDKLGAALGEDAERVRFADMHELGHNPARIIPAWRRFVDDNAGAPARGIGEPIWAGRDGEVLVECQLHEALLNVAFADAPAFSLMCPYDVTALDAGVVHEARCSHHGVLDGEAHEPSRDYRGLDQVAAPFAAPLPKPPASTRVLAFDRNALGEVRALAASLAGECGMGEARRQDFVLAVNELATNSVLHGGGGGVLRGWVEPGEAVCEIRDQGRIADPLVGRREPAFDQVGGWGVWLANQVCDLVQIRSLASGTVIRARMSASG